MISMKSVALSTVLSLLAPAVALAAAPCPPSGAPALLTFVEGEGPPLVMLGGGLMGAATWAQHARRLSPHRRVFRPQALNTQYGLQDRPLPPGYSVRMESCALAATLDAHRLSGAVDLVGQSAGGLVALDFAMNYPHRVRTLTLVEPPVAWLLPAEERRSPEIVQWERVTMALAKDEVTEADLVAFTCAVQGCPPGSTVEQMRTQPGWAERVRYRGSLRLGRAVATHRDDPARLMRFKHPLLYVAGAGASPAHRRFNAAFRRSMPGARVVELPGGHAAATVSIDAFLAELTRFLDQPIRSE